MEYLGLFIEFVFLAIGIYLYLFSRGLIKFGEPGAQAKAEAFRNSNGWWLRLGGIALVAMMSINIYLHLRDLWN